MRVSIRPRSVRHLCLLVFSLSAIGACTVAPLTLKVDEKATAPVIDGFGASTLVPSVANEAARRLFAQGMAQVYAFNEVEAIRSFKAALAQDPNCAMCAWGVALKMGPHINNPTRGDLRVAMSYLDYAVRHKQGASERDQALIDSLAVRYGHVAARALPPVPGADICRAPGGAKADPLDIAYADHMRALAARFPDDPDVLSQYAEAAMVATSRMDWWDRETGKPAPRIGELATMLEASLKQHPEHVGLNHYMIHAVDAVQVAPRAVASADRLGKLAPKSPHLLHMPSHTYALVGRYADATRVNQLAVAADEALAEDMKKQNFSVTKDWRGHNTHFQWYGALMEGRAELALTTARTAAGRAKGDHEFAEYTRSLPLLTLLHLQRWDALLKEPAATGNKGIAALLADMSRGIAMARSGQVAEARAALARIETTAKKLTAKHSGTDGGSKIIRSLANSAPAQLGAEIAWAEQRIDDALALQAKAVAVGADADMTEPPMLAGGPRLRLGRMQLQAKRFTAAEQTFRADLALRPANGWALQGLEKALAEQGKQAGAVRAKADLAASWPLAESEVRAN
ncbi:MAG TPA: hypothetical protein VFT37_07720 [Telluria sp.]|nr:hypothetical protein [Telluria sp.]